MKEDSSPFLCLSELYNYLSHLEQFGIKLGLENISTLLARLGSPQDKLFTIHIAGTNGKGSCAAMLESILTSAGYKVGLYTSPHLIDMRERIRINKEEIPASDFIEVSNKVRQHCPETITYFEFLTAVALQYFSQENVDITILETGMGGRLDATNVCRGDYCIITDIDLDHTHHLGRTIPEITLEKGGIIKKGGKIVIAEDNKGLNVIKKLVEQRCAELYYSYSVEIIERGLYYQRVKIKSSRTYNLNLLGDFQAKNLGLVLRIVELLQVSYNIPSKAIRDGLEDVVWPGRFHLVNYLPPVVLDGAHNPSAWSSLVESVKIYFPKRRLVLLFGVLEDKDYTKASNIFQPLADKVILTRPDNVRGLSPRKLIQYFDESIIINNPMEAFQFATSNLSSTDCLLVTGSLYLLGTIYNYLKINKYSWDVG